MEGVEHTPGGVLFCGTGCVVSYGTRIYMVKGWGSEPFLRYKALYEMGAVAQAPRGVLV